MTHILIDGDNISIERYFNEVYPSIITEYSNIHTTLVCQSNVIIKFVSNRVIDISIRCCKTTNKNATDANIIYLAGKSNALGEKVVIVSNDKIYYEISNDNCIVKSCIKISDEQYTKKLKKKLIINAIKSIKDKNEPSYDIHLSDLENYFPHHSIAELRKYIDSLHDTVFISNSDCVYIRNY